MTGGGGPRRATRARARHSSAGAHLHALLRDEDHGVGAAHAQRRQARALDSLERVLCKQRAQGQGRRRCGGSTRGGAEVARQTGLHLLTDLVQPAFRAENRNRPVKLLSRGHRDGKKRARDVSARLRAR